MIISEDGYLGDYHGYWLRMVEVHSHEENCLETIEDLDELMTSNPGFRSLRFNGWLHTNLAPCSPVGHRSGDPQHVVTH